MNSQPQTAVADISEMAAISSAHSTSGKKVIFVSLTNYAGGAENILLMMARTINSKILFLRKLNRSCLSMPESQAARYLTQKPLIIGFILLLKELIRYRKGYTIISTHPYLNAYLGFLKGIGYLRSDLVVRECTSVFTRFKGYKKLSYQVAYYFGYRSVDLIICQTDIMRDQLLKQNTFIPKRKALVLSNPIDLKLINSKARDQSNDKDLNTEFICTAGRLIPLKGFSILIKAFKDLLQEHPNLKLLILGEGKDRATLTSLIEELNLESRVILKGHISNPVPYFEKAKLCVISSIQEGFPNVLLEMMAVNDNVVSTLCAGGIEDIPSITKVKVNDEKALSTALQVALAQPRQKAANGQVSSYLKDRSPQRFLEAILKEI